AWDHAARHFQAGQAGERFGVQAVDVTGGLESRVHGGQGMGNERLNGFPGRGGRAVCASGSGHGYETLLSERRSLGNDRFLVEFAAQRSFLCDPGRVIVQRWEKFTGRKAERLSTAEVPS
ncbi:MAG: hypothetical protein ACK5TP_10470, partial [bacterium]